MFLSSSTEGNQQINSTQQNKHPDEQKQRQYAYCAYICEKIFFLKTLSKLFSKAL